MKKTYYLFAVLMLLLLNSCIEAGDTVIEQTSAETLSGSIESNKTLTNDRIWELSGKVVVDNGVTLTIEPGTIIKSKAGTGSLATALIIARDGMIDAQGTASEPIIFTTVSDNIQIGETQGTNLSENTSGLWGGVVILGKATCSLDTNTLEAQIEGIPANDTFGAYGGDEDDHNSGILNYVSIRHGGALLGEGNELNGLTLGGVGSGTQISNIEVVGNVDDGIEFFGGTVDASNLLVWAQGDDGLDIDQGYSGTITNSVVILGENSDHAMEIDGPEGSINGSFTLNNITLIGNQTTAAGEYADYRANAMGASNNIFAKGFKDSSDVELDNDLVATNYNNNVLTFGTWEVVLPSGVSNISDIFKNNGDTVLAPNFANTGTAVVDGNETVGANLSDFTWTYASSKNAF